MAVVVGISGYANHGKGECAKALISLGFVEVNFADTLKRILSAVYHLPLEYFIDPVLKETPHSNLGGKTPRQAMQHVGTKGFRTFFEDTWVNAWMRNAQAELNEGNNIVVPDVRFPNEWRVLKSLSPSILVAVERPGFNLGEVYEDESEKHVELLRSVADVVLVNDGTVQQLQNKLLENLDLVGVV